MPSVYVDAAQVAFPPKCPHCGQPPDATRLISARRTLYAIFSEYIPAASLAVPVCAAAARRRKVLGAVAALAEIAFILVGGFVTMALALGEHALGAAVLGAAILAIVALRRTGWDDALLDWWVVGVLARQVRGPGTRLRVSVRRDEYFSEWAAVNPVASTAGGVIGWPPPPQPPEDPNAPLDPIIHNRRIPAVALVVSATAVALQHWYAVNGGHVFLFALCLLTAVGFLAIGGIVYPPVFWSISAHGKRLPLPLKVVGALLGIAGLAGGFVLGISYGR
ncbi:MAG TPA: hypothetical protein VF921_02265 [Vicinamibacterales bacterium]